MSWNPLTMRKNQPGAIPTWEEITMTPTPSSTLVNRNARNTHPDEVTMTPSEWRDAVNRELADLKLTYEDLVEQARRRDFSSLEARKLWLTIGGRRP